MQPAKHPGGRPPINIDLRQLEELAAIQATMEEIASVLGVTRRTLTRKMKQREYLEAFEKGRAKGRISVRRAQWKAAADGNPTAMIWWGKQYMGQREIRPADYLPGAIDGDAETVLANVDDARAKLKRLLDQGAERLAAADKAGSQTQVG